jgi:hypothetical protein
MFTYDILVPKLEVPEDDYDFWAVSFFNDMGEEVFRDDADSKELKKAYKVKSDYIRIKRTFLVDRATKRWAIWLHHPQNGWIKQLNGNI